jgi:hypothetical protein
LESNAFWGTRDGPGLQLKWQATAVNLISIGSQRQ